MASKRCAVLFMAQSKCKKDRESLIPKKISLVEERKREEEERRREEEKKKKEEEEEKKKVEPEEAEEELKKQIVGEEPDVDGEVQYSKERHSSWVSLLPIDMVVITTGFAPKNYLPTILKDWHEEGDSLVYYFENRFRQKNIVYPCYHRVRLLARMQSPESEKEQPPLHKLNSSMAEIAAAKDLRSAVQKSVTALYRTFTRTIKRSQNSNQTRKYGIRLALDVFTNRGKEIKF
jgi:hypothetical protein